MNDETWTRRRVISAFLGAAAAGAAAPVAARLAPTPRQTAGPFYPERLPLDADADLVAVAGRPAPAAGRVAHVTGRVLDEDGTPVDGARVEIWQCDSRGRYHHPRDRGGRADPNFQGFGHTVTRPGGGYRFRTIAPVPYPGRTPHIHFAVLAPGFGRLTTQLYVAGDPGNARDVLLGRLSPAARAAVTVPFAPAPANPAEVAADFTIVLGQNAT